MLGLMAEETGALPLLDKAGPWPIRAAWALLPLLSGPTFAAALDPTSSGFRTTVSIALWLTWAVGLAIMFVTRTVTLTAMRILVFGNLAATSWAVVKVGLRDLEVIDVVAVAAALIVVALASLASTITAFVDGSSYGPEHRLPLRTPLPLLLGPGLIALVAAVIGLTSGPLLLASGQWLLGLIALVVGAGLAAFGVRGLHSLSRRWVVLVPAGVVIHDLVAMVDPLLVPVPRIKTLRAATQEDGAAEGAVDLSLGAPGLVLVLEMTEALELGRRDNRGRSQQVSATSLLFTPAQPGRTLRAARLRKFPVSTLR